MKSSEIDASFIGIAIVGLVVMAILRRSSCLS